MAKKLIPGFVILFSVIIILGFAHATFAAGDYRTASQCQEIAATIPPACKSATGDVNSCTVAVTTFRTYCNNNWLSGVTSQCIFSNNEDNCSGIQNFDITNQAYQAAASFSASNMFVDPAQGTAPGCGVFLPNCFSQNECVLERQWVWTNGSCVACAIDSDCGTGKYCAQGTSSKECRDLKAVNESCANPDECLSGECTGGVCTASANVTCTSFTYSNWSDCVGGQQTRTKISALPSGCSNGTPILTQACTFTGAGIYPLECQCTGTSIEPTNPCATHCSGVAGGITLCICSASGPSGAKGSYSTCSAMCNPSGSGSGAGTAGSSGAGTADQTLKDATASIDKIIGGTGVMVKEGNINVIVGKLLKSLLGIIGLVALVIFVYSGIIWMTAAGVAKEIETAQNSMIWAAIGLFAVFISYALIKYAVGMLAF